MHLNAFSRFILFNDSICTLSVGWPRYILYLHKRLQIPNSHYSFANPHKCTYTQGIHLFLNLYQNSEKCCSEKWRLFALDANDFFKQSGNRAFFSLLWVQIQRPTNVFPGGIHYISYDSSLLFYNICHGTENLQWLRVMSATSFHKQSLTPCC